jgi:hypothetical protein
MFPCEGSLSVARLTAANECEHAASHGFNSPLRGSVEELELAY